MSDFAGLRLPPHSIEAEQSVIIGGMLLNNRAWEVALPRHRQRGRFRCRHDHRLIWQHIAQLMRQDRPRHAVLTVNDPTRDRHDRRQARGRCGRTFLPQQPGDQRRLGGQRAPLRRDGAGPLHPAPAGGGVGRDRHRRPQRPGPPGQRDPGCRGIAHLPDLRGQRQAAQGLPGTRQPPRRGLSSGRRPLQPRQSERDHRRLHRLHRPRPDDFRGCSRGT